jgi:hypothetical protein
MYRKLKERSDGKGKPEYRLRMFTLFFRGALSHYFPQLPWFPVQFFCPSDSLSWDGPHEQTFRGLHQISCVSICFAYMSKFRFNTRFVQQGIALVGAGVILNFQSIQTYVIDAFTLHAASALAAVAFLRSLCGFGFPLFAPAMYKALGYGKGNTILAVIAIVLGCPA